MIQAASKLKLLRRELGRKSILDFAKFYFPHYMTTKSCPFHDDICRLLMDMSEKHDDGRLAIAAPRGHAKSTVVSFFYVMWSICYEKEKFVLILSATAKQAQTLLADISKALETNSKLLDDFSDVFTEKNIKSKWTQDEIITKNGIKITALGSGQDLRGLKKYQDRPTLIILDDLDSAKNTYNSPVREKVSNWFTKDVMKAGAKGFSVVAVGTLLHPDSLLSRLTKEQEYPDWEKRIYKAVIKFSDRHDLWQKWSNILFGRGDLYEEEFGLKAADKFFAAHKQEMLEGTEVLWAEIEDYYKLMKIRETQGTYSFDSEKQNDPTNARDSRYDPDKFYYWDDQFDTVEKLIASFGDEYSIIAACDPSTGITDREADHSAIIVMAKYKGRLYVIDADIMQRSQDDLVQAILNYCKIRRPMEKFVIESNTFPELLAKYIRERAMQENVIAPLKEIRITKNKELRVFGMETYITTGIMQFSRRHQTLLDQLKYFPRDSHDDGPDALEMALREAELNNVTFMDLTGKKDKYGREENHPDYGRPSVIDDSEDDDDYDQGKMRGYSL